MGTLVMKFWHLIGTVVVLSLTACQSELLRPELPRRYKSMTQEKRAPEKPLVRVSAFVLETPKPTDEPIVLQLSERGQASLISEIAKVDDSLTGLYQQLSKSFAKQPSSDVIDRSEFTRRVVFSTQTTELIGPADRISKLEFKLELGKDSKYLEFQKWNRFETEYGQVDLGKIGLKKGAQLSAKLSPTFGGTLNAGEAGIAVSKELAEEIALRQRFIALTGTLDRTHAILTQEGVVGIDLTGNTSVDLTVKFSYVVEEVVKFDSLKTSKGLKTPKEVSYRIVHIYIPEKDVVKELKKGVQFSLSGNYVLRQVGEGDDTITEGDDAVLFVQGKLTADPKTLSLMDNEQLKNLRTIFSIQYRGDPGETLAIDTPRSTRSLYFATNEEAEDFLDWLNLVSKQSASKPNGNIKVGGSELKLKEKPLKQSDVVNLRIGIRE